MGAAGAAGAAGVGVGVGRVARLACFSRCVTGVGAGLALVVVALRAASSRSGVASERMVVDAACSLAPAGDGFAAASVAGVRDVARPVRANNTAVTTSTAVQALSSECSVRRLNNIGVMLANRDRVATL